MASKDVLQTVHKLEVFLQNGKNPLKIPLKMTENMNSHVNGRSFIRSLKNLNDVQFIRSIFLRVIVQFIVQQKWTSFVNAVQMNAVH